MFHLLAKDADTKSITYEVNGGVAEGKTHEEISDQVNAVNLNLDAESVETTVEESDDVTTEEASTEETDDSAGVESDDVPPSSATRAAGSFVGALAATMLL